MSKPKTRVYLVQWEIEVEAESDEAAAELALEIHRNTASIATVFTVTGPTGKRSVVDLGFDERLRD